MSESNKKQKNSIKVRVSSLLMVICFVGLITYLSDITLIEVDTMSQNPDYPTGCEMISAVMVLDYYGFDVTVDEFSDKYLFKGNAPYKTDGVWYSSDPDMVFLGKPESKNGWGIWAKGLARSINYFFDENGITADAVFFCSESLESLCLKYIRNNIPVIVWCTMDMADPYTNISPRIENSSDSFTWISPNHCMVLVGYDATGYYFNDPMTGECRKFGKTESQIAFDANNSQAVVIVTDN